ncbi:MAG TPA: hypothetical protein VJ901_04615 [Thermoanaerobaculia bacterium]|nr:hypothetical protein [Thermoanaerobaculia bacterium]
MSFDAKTLYELLPAIYRIRDAENGEPLKALLQVIGEQAGVLEENLAQLYDDEFAETAASWVLPYIGDLIGITGLPSTGSTSLTPRAEVAHTIGYRRRKGTAAMLEQLAHDVTRWDAHAVEFFQLICATQYMNHLRPENQSFLNVRDADRLEELGGAFERNTKFGEPDITHTVDVRRIAKGHGRYNIPNVGIFLWRIKAMLLTRSPAVAVSGGTQFFFFDPLGRDLPLFNRPESETSASHLAEPINVPDRIRRRVLRNHLDDYYGDDKDSKSILIELADNASTDPIPSNQIEVCDLSDWINVPKTKVSIDPVLGRIAFPANQSKQVLVTFHYGFPASMGGGQYSRLLSADTSALGIVRVTSTINNALGQLSSDGGTVEIPNSSRYRESITLDATNKFLELRAGDKHRPTIELTGDLQITGGAHDEVVLDGLLVTGGTVHVTGGLGRLRLRHCTFAPAGAANIVIASKNTIVEIDHCITGGIVADVSAEVHVAGSIIDATSDTIAAYAGPVDWGGPLRITNSTVIGTVKTSILRLASNTIFVSPVLAERRQEGCVRFSYVAPGSRVPARFECQPEGDASLVRPELTSARFGDPAYCQLSASCPSEIRQGADDESEMGAYHDLFEPQKEAHLRTRLEEYLRFGLEAGLFFVT